MAATLHAVRWLSQPTYCRSASASWTIHPGSLPCRVLVPVCLLESPDKWLMCTNWPTSMIAKAAAATATI